MPELSRSASRVQQALQEAGLSLQVVELDASTRTAELAAQAIGAPVGAIVKTLVCIAGDRPVLALVSGDRRASMAKIADAVGASSARMATAVEARDITGYAVGGVPPVGHTLPLPVLVDEGLSRFTTVHAAAGTPRAVFAIGYADLLRATGGRVADVTEAQ